MKTGHAKDKRQKPLFLSPKGTFEKLFQQNRDKEGGGDFKSLTGPYAEEKSVQTYRQGEEGSQKITLKCLT